MWLRASEIIVKLIHMDTISIEAIYIVVSFTIYKLLP